MVASARLCAVASVSKLSPLHGFARCRSLGACVAIRLPHQPHRVEHGALAATPFKARHIDRDAPRRAEVAKWRRGYIWSAEQHWEVISYDFRETLVERCYRSSVEFLDTNHVGTLLHDELGPIDSCGN
jgi:hypothetical protein